MPEQKIYNAPVFVKQGRGRPPKYNLEPFNVGDYMIIDPKHVRSQRNRVAHINASDPAGRKFQVVRVDANHWVVQRIA